MSIILQSSGGGSVTINEPTTASNFTQTLPAATGTILTTATTGVCQAWVNFNGVSGVSIRASYNISSVTRASTGVYTVNFTNALADANYVVNISSASSGSNYTIPNPFVNAGGGNDAPTSSSFGLRTQSQNVVTTSSDSAYIMVSVFR